MAADDDATAAPHAQRLGPYELRDLLGRGGMGAVYRAHDPRLRRDVAVKVMIAGADAPAELLARFVREAQATARLGNHPGIVPVLDVGQVEGRHYIVMELVDGAPLDRCIDEGEVPVRRAVRIAAHVARAVAHAHAHGILHRDLKPANVLLTREGEPRLTDFGLARVEDDGASLTRSGSLVGTPAYMAPEQVRGRRDGIDVRTDVYGIGAVLYEMLTDAPPFAGGNTAEVLHRVVAQPPRPPRRANPAVPRDVDTICLKAIEKEPGRRYPTALALAEDLERWLAGHPISARPIAAPARALRWIRRSPALAAAVGAVALLALWAAAWGVSAWRAGAERRRLEAEAQLATDLGRHEVAWTRLAALAARWPARADYVARRDAARQAMQRVQAQQIERERALERRAVAEAFAAQLVEALGEFRAVAARVRAAHAAGVTAQAALLDGDADAGDADASERLAAAVRELHALRSGLLERAWGAAVVAATGACRYPTDAVRRDVDALFAERAALEREGGRFDRAAATTAERGRLLPTSARVGAPAGRLQCASAPAGARVTLVALSDADGRRVPGPPRDLGPTPLGPVDLPPGAYEVRLQGEGYAEVRWPVWVRPGETTAPPVPIRLLTPDAIGAGFVYVPGGVTWLGVPEPEGTDLLWSPEPVAGFLCARFETTVAEYGAFLEAQAAAGESLEALIPRVNGEPLYTATAGTAPPAVRPAMGAPTWPVMGVTRRQAEWYCAWRSARDGRAVRLPTEREWLRAAAGADGRPFPWGDGFRPDRCVHADWTGHARGAITPHPVGAAARDTSPFGVRDCAGSLAEWCAGLADPAHGAGAVRGGSFMTLADHCTLTRRHLLEVDLAEPWVGFRVVADLP